MNSRNSSKPPSSDGYAKPSPKSRRVTSGKKPVKQPGGMGHHLAQRSDPDQVITHSPTICKNCGSDLSDAEITGKRGRPKRSKALNLLNRLDLCADDVLRFANDFDVPFSNNLSEQDIRMVKLQQKISGGFRGSHGAGAFLAFRSYLSTATKQGINLLDALQSLFNGSPWMPAEKGASP